MSQTNILTEVLVEAKIEGRRALPRDELLEKAYFRNSLFTYLSYVLRLDALLADGTFKLTAGGKIGLGKKREMQHAIAANGFERALIFSSDVLALVLSFGDFETVIASEIASRSLSCHTSPAWRALVLSDFPMLRLVMNDTHHRASPGEWRQLYRLSMQKFTPSYVRDLPENLLPPPPALTEYTFLFEIWSSNPDDRDGGILIDSGRWDLGTDRRAYNGVYLVKPMEALSTPLPLPQGHYYYGHYDKGQFLRALVAKRTSLGVETFVIYNSNFYRHAEHTVDLEFRSVTDLIIAKARYDHLEREFSSPRPITRIRLRAAIDPAREARRRGPAPERVPAGLYMEFAWLDDEDRCEPMEVSHVERLLERHVDWS